MKETAERFDERIRRHVKNKMFVWLVLLSFVLFIVTDKWDEVRRAIYDTCQHGSTIWAAEGGYKEDWRNVVYSVVARSDVKRVTNVVRTIDPGAFINAIPTERITGRFYQEPKD